jgi:hypothetical protein
MSRKLQRCFFITFFYKHKPDCYFGPINGLKNIKTIQQSSSTLEENSR